MQRRDFAWLDGDLAALTARFWSKVDTTGDCWEWTAALFPSGYGAFGMWRNGRTEVWRAARVALALELNEPIPDGLNVLHTCDNRLCVRPSHLYAGSQQQNVDDMWSRGRGCAGSRWRETHERTHARGAHHPNARLTEQQVRTIRDRLAAGVGCSDIGREFGVTDSAIRRIRDGFNWRHVA